MVTKQRIIHNFWLLLNLWIVLQSCSEERGSYPEPLPVVEAYLESGKPIRVQITREISYGAADTLSPLRGLSPQIEHQGSRYRLVEAEPGVYASDSLVCTAGDTYRLSFTYLDREISAETTIPLSPGEVTASATAIAVPNLGSGTGVEIPDPIQYRWHNPERAYHVLVVKNVEANPQPITFNLGDDVIEKPEPTFRLPPHRGDSQQLSIGRFVYYGRHAAILYRIQPEYVALYEASGSNSMDLVTPPTNVIGGLGIFTGVHASDTLWVHVW